MLQYYLAKLYNFLSSPLSFICLFINKNSIYQELTVTLFYGSYYLGVIFTFI